MSKTNNTIDTEIGRYFNFLIKQAEFSVLEIARAGKKSDRENLAAKFIEGELDNLNDEIQRYIRDAINAYNAKN